MIPGPFTPADQNQVATSGNSRQSLQFPINIAAKFDLPPQPDTIAPYYFVARSVFADSKWIAKQRRSADVHAVAAICLFVLDPNHLQVSFLSVIKSLLTARNCLHPPDHSARPFGLMSPPASLCFKKEQR